MTSAAPPPTGATWSTSSVRRCLRSLAAGRERQGFPEQPVTLWGRAEPHVRQAARRPTAHRAGTPIETTVNGVRRTFSSGQEKTLAAPAA